MNTNIQSVFKVVLSLSMVALAASGLSQEGSPSIVVIDGASNPELISDEALFISLSRLLETAGPDKCSPGQPQGLSRTPSCLRIDGVDMAKAERLAQQFIAYRGDRGRSDREEFCDEQQARRVPYLNPEELAAEIDSFERNSSADRVNFFTERGYALLGQDGMNRLMSWANDNLRRDIDERKINHADLMRRSNFGPQQLLQAFCSTGQ